MEPIVYNTKTAAELLGCSERRLREQLYARKFPGRMIAGRWMLSQADLDAIIEMSAVPRGGADV
jgi:hypothetical protein